MAVSTNVQVRFSVSTKYGVYSDSLYYSVVDYLKKSEQDIQSDIDNRISIWTYNLEHPTIESDNTA